MCPLGKTGPAASNSETGTSNTDFAADNTKPKTAVAGPSDANPELLRHPAVATTEPDTVKLDLATASPQKESSLLM